jgi:hypothetical protein
MLAFTTVVEHDEQQSSTASHHVRSSYEPDSFEARSRPEAFPDLTYRVDLRRHGVSHLQLLKITRSDNTIMRLCNYLSRSVVAQSKTLPSISEHATVTNPAYSKSSLLNEQFLQTEPMKKSTLLTDCFSHGRVHVTHPHAELGVPTSSPPSLISNPQ